MWRRDQMMRKRASQRSRMEWRAAGAQFYPGGAYEQLSELSRRSRGAQEHTRADELLREIICEQLDAETAIDASDVSVEVERREVTLRGTVVDRRQKHAIEDLVADVTGVSTIHNHLNVAESSTGP